MPTVPDGVESLGRVGRFDPTIHSFPLGRYFRLSGGTLDYLTAAPSPAEPGIVRLCLPGQRDPDPYITGRGPRSRFCATV